jgi:HAD superfamily hydrolase (TIGR01490 family)
MDKEIVALFDFDGTITTKDTFVPFLYAAFGKRRVYKTFFRLAPQAFLVAIGLFSRDKFKECITKLLFRDQYVDIMRQIGSKYAKTLYRLYRPTALQRIEWHKSNGHRCIMVSASLDLYLRDVCNSLGFDDLICTILSNNNFVFDGTLKYGNCRRKEKVNQLKLILGDLNNYDIYGYGDTIGDYEMLNIANHSFYRPFESENFQN